MLASSPGFEADRHAFLNFSCANDCRHICWWHHSQQLPDMCVGSPLACQVPRFGHVPTIQVKSKGAFRGHNRITVCSTCQGEIAGTLHRLNSTHKTINVAGLVAWIVLFSVHTLYTNACCTCNWPSHLLIGHLKFLFVVDVYFIISLSECKCYRCLSCRIFRWNL
jgi:hypothetical protein